jgi:hypothetical protein
MPDSATTILFGAFDRHNLGDLLFPHVLSALLPDRPLLFAGLVKRDLRACGGHEVHSIAQLAQEIDHPVNVIHVGGELLTCETHEARAMLPSDGTAHIVEPAPYIADKRRFRRPAWFGCNAVGGADFDVASPGLRDAVIARLRIMDSVTVRDQRTQAALARHCVPATLLPDPGVMTAALFAQRIAEHGAKGEVAGIADAFPAGYLTLQFSADFTDDVSLTALSAACDRLVAATGLGIALFRAGAAPLHDNLDLYRALRQRMREPTRAVPFESLDIWDICALIAGSTGYLGSSLHGRIVALAYGLPRVTLVLPAGGQPSKHQAFIDAWEDAAMPGTALPEQGASALLAAMDVERARSLAHADRLVGLYRAGCEAWRSRMPPSP